MAKILKITEDTVYVGETGKVIKVDKNNIDWNAKVGEEVEMYEADDEIFLLRKNNLEQKSQSGINQHEGINIVVNNASNNKNEGYADTANKTLVNKTTYIICAIFFGWFGLHRIIAGQVGVGVAMFLLSWTFIPAIIGLCDAFAAMGKPADRAGNILI